MRNHEQFKREYEQLRNMMEECPDSPEIKKLKEKLLAARKMRMKMLRPRKERPPE